MSIERSDRDRAQTILPLKERMESHRKSFVSRFRVLTAGLLGAVLAIPPAVSSCLSSIQEQLEAMQKECETLMRRSKNTIVLPGRTDPFPDYFNWVDTKVREVNERKEDRCWGDPRFMMGDFDLDVAYDQDGNERWRGRCGGFARDFIISAAEAGFEEVRFYIAACPIGKGEFPLYVHFYGVARAGETWWVLQQGRTFGMSIVQNPYDAMKKEYRYIKECFRCVRPTKEKS